MYLGTLYSSVLTVAPARLLLMGNCGRRRWLSTLAQALGVLGYWGTSKLTMTPACLETPAGRACLMGLWVGYRPIIFLWSDDKTAFLAQSRTRPKQTSTSGPGQPLGRQ